MRFRFLLSAIFLLGVSSLFAELRVPHVFGDHMVVQCDKPVRVWGWAVAGKKVEVELGDRKASATANAQGEWLAMLEPMKASFTASDLKITSGNKKKVFEDVLVGEVWLCGGQSNMEWTLSGTLNADVEIDSADSPAVRCLRVPKIASGQTKDDFPIGEGGEHVGRWMKATPEEAGRFTAVGYYFAQRLSRRLKVPVGLIDTSWGGTMAQFWVSNETLGGIQEMKSYLSDHQKALQDWTKGGGEGGAKKRFETDMAIWEKAKKEAEARGGKAPGGRPNARNYTDPAKKAHPGAMYRGTLMPIAPFTVRGALFYQGENNSFGESWKPFPKTFPAVVSDWRRAFQDEKLPMGLIQIAGWSTRRSMSYDMNHHTNVVREVQLHTWQNTPETGLIVSYDANSDGNIHPRHKRPVGERSARWALAEVYGVKRPRSDQALEWRGPVYQSVEFAEGKAIISFEQGTALGLRLNKDTDLGFVIAGEDKEFHVARARVLGVQGKDAQLEVWAGEVANPKAVRYAQSNLPNGSLLNGNELPAYPFRTDRWPLVPHQSRGEYVPE